MKKVLLLCCFISMAAQAGTGGGTSTPPGRGGLAKLMAENLELDGAKLFRWNGILPLPEEMRVSTDSADTQSLASASIADVTNQAGETRSYRVTDGDELNQVVLKARRALLRNGMNRQP